MIRSVILALVLMLIAAPCLAQTIDSQVRDEIRETLKKHDKALNEQDMAGVMATYAPGENTVLLGTGPGERWVGAAEIESAYTEFFKDYDPNTVDINCTWSSAGAKGEVAWLVAMCQITDFLKNQQREFALNISAVLEKLEGQWRFRMFHFSNLTGGAARPAE